MKTHFLGWIGLWALLSLLSCSSQQQADDLYALQPTRETVSFPLSERTTTYIKSLSVFTDSLGKKYLTFMSNEAPEIYLYDLHTAHPVKTIRFHREGPDGVGPKVGGFLMTGYRAIFLPNLYVPEISRIDSSGRKLEVLRLGDAPASFPFITTRSVVGLPMYEIDRMLHCPQLVNPRLGDRKKTESPVAVKVRLDTKEADASAFCYPSFLCKESHEPSLGIESKASCCYNGEEWVYSFAFDEHLYVLSKDYKLIRKVKASSRHMNQVAVPDVVPSQMDQALRMMCELPYYGDVVYDAYRQLYYRFAYLQESLDKGENVSDALQSGRGRFSVLILDKDLKVVGETLLPENRYRPNLYYVEEKGLYLSTNHYKNPDYDEDNLIFERWVVAPDEK